MFFQNFKKQTNGVPVLMNLSYWWIIKKFVIWKDRSQIWNSFNSYIIIMTIVDELFQVNNK